MQLSICVHFTGLVVDCDTFLKAPKNLWYKYYVFCIWSVLNTVEMIWKRRREKGKRIRGRASEEEREGEFRSRNFRYTFRPL